MSKQNIFYLSAQEVILLRLKLLKSRKFYIRRNNNKVDSIETGRIVIAHLLH